MLLSVIGVATFALVPIANCDAAAFVAIFIDIVAVAIAIVVYGI